MAFDYPMKPILLLFTVLCFRISSATQIIAVANNSSGWDVPSNWNLNRVPVNNDTVMIPPSMQMDVKGSVYGSPAPNLFLSIAGTLYFDPSGKLDLGLSSTVIILG